MSVSEQVKKLREFAKEYAECGRWDGADFMSEAANTIESLSAKLDAANRELERWHTDHINENIKNPFAWTSTLCCHNCDHKDEYIEELEADRPEKDGWIPCKDRLPKDDTKVLVRFEYFRYGEYNRLFQTIGISYMYGGKWSGFVNGESGWDKLRIIAWQPLPEQYHEP